MTPERKGIKKEIRLGKGARKHIRDLKQKGRKSDAGTFYRQESRETLRFSVSEHLKRSSFGILDEVKPGKRREAIEEWMDIRLSYKTGQTAGEEFHNKRREFVKKYEDVIDDPLVTRACSFITTSTSKN